MNEDLKLVQACLSGHAQAFEHIVSRYQGLICAITYSATGQTESSEELAHETFVQAWKNLNQLKEPQKLRGWLCTIARNLIHNHIRSQKYLPVTHSIIEDVHPDEHGISPEDNLIRQEEEEMIQAALMQIPEEYREPLVLFYRQDQSTKEVADLIGLPEATVRTRLHRGRKMLRQQMEAKIARSLKQSSPGPAFTLSVMVGIGGLAVGMATSASAATAAAVSAEAASGTGLTAAAGGLFTAASAKIIAVAAALLVTAGAAIYTARHFDHPAKQTPAEQVVVVQNAPDKLKNETAEERISEAMLAAAGSSINNSVPVEMATPELPASAEKDQAASIVRHPDWPGLDQPIKHVYSQSHLKYTDGKKKEERFWARLPDAFREEGLFDKINKITIDNGKKRLVLDPGTMQAQYEPTWFADGKMIWQFSQSLEKHPNLSMAGIFRDPNSEPEYKLTRLVQQDNDSVMFYHIEYLDGTGIHFKASIDKRTLLPERIEAVVTGEPNQYGNVSEGEVLFDFSPIADSVFSTDIPSGYQTAPEKQPNTFTGQVIDVSGNPVIGAEVFLHNPSGSGVPWKATSDDKGLFSIAMWPFDTGFSGSVVLWAVLPSEPNLIAWTVLIDPHENEDSRRTLAGTIPGDPGIVYSSEGYFYEKIENGFRTQGVWCAGASKIVLVMEPGTSVAGNVSDIFGNAVSDARIGFEIDWLTDIYENSTNWLFPRGMIQTSTEADGHYAISNFPRLWKGCAFSMSVQPPIDTGLVQDEKQIRIEDPNQAVEANFVLLPKGPTVHGILRDNYGTPLAEREIYITVNGKGFPGYQTRTDKDGRFEFMNCPADARLEVRARLSHNMTSIMGKAHASYVYYPDVTARVGYEDQEDEYEVELVAVKPEIVIDAIVTDSAGNPLPWFPVEIRADESFSTRWKQDQRFHKRTDENGRCTFTNVPEMKGLRLVCSYFLEPWTDRLETDQTRQHFKELEQTYKIYHWNETFVPLESGRKDYDMHVVILTENEYRQRK